MLVLLSENALTGSTFAASLPRDLVVKGLLPAMAYAAGGKSESADRPDSAYPQSLGISHFRFMNFRR
jgi:hypothetical protein